MQRVELPRDFLFVSYQWVDPTSNRNFSISFRLKPLTRKERLLVLTMTWLTRKPPKTALFLVPTYRNITKPDNFPRIFVFFRQRATPRRSPRQTNKRPPTTCFQLKKLPDIPMFINSPSWLILTMAACERDVNLIFVRGLLSRVIKAIITL